MQKIATFLLVVFAFCVTGKQALALKAQDVYGIWRDAKNEGLLKIYSCADKLCIKITKVKKKGVRDELNPNRALRNRHLLGVSIMSDGKKTGPVVWKGHIYNPEDGRTYAGSLKLIKENKIKLTGCVLGGLFCNSEVWQKVAE
jgi:uncharacterized protein (DUF2147 family)